LPPKKGRLEMKNMIERKVEKKASTLKKIAKIFLITLGIGAIFGAVTALGIHGMIKKVFVNEKWPDEEWSSDDWAEEELEN
jgi:hypothetical protein